MNFLVSIPITSTGEVTVSINLQHPQIGQNVTGWTQIDWGDGTLDTISDINETYGNLTHTYYSAGQFCVSCTTSSFCCRLHRISFPNVLIIKLGKSTYCNYNQSNSFAGLNVYYVKCSGEGINYMDPYGQGNYEGNQFNGCTLLHKVDTYTALDRITAGVFYSCRRLSNLDLSEVLYIDKNGLQGTAFKKISLPKCIDIGNYGLANIAQVKYIDAPILTAVSNSMCYNNINLENIVIPNVVTIGDDAFYGCERLKNIYIPKCTSIGVRAFANCSELQSVTVAENCTFGTNCFQNCYSLER